MARLLKKFHVSNGDIIAIKHQSNLSNKQDIEGVIHALERLKVNALVIVVDDFDDLSVLNETEMNRRGWYKFKSLAKLMKLPEKEVQ